MRHVCQRGIFVGSSIRSEEEAWALCAAHISYTGSVPERNAALVVSSRCCVGRQPAHVKRGGAR